MKQFGTILRFELYSYLKNKIFVGITLFMMVAIAVVMFFPRFTGGGGADGDPDESADRGVIIIATADQAVSENTEMIRAAFEAAFPGYKVQTVAGSENDVKDQIVSGKAECAFVLNSPTSYTYYVNNLSMYDVNMSVADEVLINIYRMNAMTQSGLSSEEAANIMSAVMQHESVSLGKDQAQNFFYTYIMIFALYMVILLYGQMVATNVATEKSSRAMELLITSAKPASMMFGKVIASCLAGLIQLVAVFGSAFIFYNINSSYWEGNFIVASIFDMPLELLAYMLVFFILGFFIYAFMYGAIGSTASKLEDINTSVMPLTMLFIVAFFVVIFSMSSGNIDNMVMRICSYIPFTSPMAMFTRIAMSSVPWYEIVISIGILIASVIGIGVLSAKIYRVGVLLYGTPPKLSSIIKAIKKA